MIDWGQVAALREQVGTDAFAEVVEIFLEEVEDEIEALRCVTDLDEISARLHFLKGSALNLGFTDFSGLCAEGESLAAAGQPEKAEINKIIQLFSSSRNAFLAGLNQRLAG